MMMKPIFSFICTIAIIFGVMGCSAEDKENDYADRMSGEHKGDAPIKNGSSALEQAQKTNGKEVNYATINGNKVMGYVAKPDSNGEEIPGLIIIHEWWGLNDNIRMMANKLAGQGYNALAVDLYHGKVAESPDSAKQFMLLVNKQQAIENLKQAYTYLDKQMHASKIGTIGWCFGGGWSLQAALAMPAKIGATVIYYSQLVTDIKQLRKLKMPILGFFGAEDSSIPPEKVQAFESALNEAGVSNSIHIYEGAGHAFANPSGTRYQKAAAEDSWAKTIQFLNATLKK